MKPVGPVHRESRDDLSLPPCYWYGTAIPSPTAWAVRRSAPSSTELTPETRRNPLQRYSEHSRTIRCDDKRFIRDPAGLLRTFSANCILPISVPYFSYTFQLPLRKGPVRFAVTKKTWLSPNSWRDWVGRHGDVYIASRDHHQGSSLDETSCHDGLAVHRPAHHLVGRLSRCNS